MEQQSANPLISFLPLILIFVVFYFLLIKPQQKQKKEHEGMLKALAKNDEVVTSGGIHGTVINVKDTSVVLRIDDNEATVLNRLKVYEEQTKPLVDYYTKSGLLKKVSGDLGVNDLFKVLSKLFVEAKIA